MYKKKVYLSRQIKCKRIQQRQQQQQPRQQQRQTTTIKTICLVLYSKMLYVDRARLPWLSRRIQILKENHSLKARTLRILNCLSSSVEDLFHLPSVGLINPVFSAQSDNRFWCDTKHRWTLFRPPGIKNIV